MKNKSFLQPENRENYVNRTALTEEDLDLVTGGKSFTPEIYIQKGDDWDKEDIRTKFISDHEEPLSCAPRPAPVAMLDREKLTTVDIEHY